MSIRYRKIFPMNELEAIEIGCRQAILVVLTMAVPGYGWHISRPYYCSISSLNEYKRNDAGFRSQNHSSLQLSGSLTVYVDNDLRIYGWFR